MLLAGNKAFRFSSNLRRVCAAVVPRGTAFFEYDWKGAGGRNLVFLAGTFVGAAIAAWFAAPPLVQIALFRFQAFHMFGIIESALAVAAVLKRCADCS